jgi:IS1 family transposase
VNTALLQHRQPDEQAVMVVRVEAAEMDEMWSFVQSKKQQRWLWHAIDHETGKVLAYVLATHEDTALKQLQQLLAPFSIQQFYTDGWGAYQRLLDEQQHTIGKANTQRIERKHLTSENADQTISKKNDLFF